MTPNLLALLQAAQAAQRNPSLVGPIAPQNPTPGFRAPALNYAPAPQLPAPTQIDPTEIAKTLGGLAGAIQRLGNQDPGIAAQRAAIAADPATQANPSTSIAGMAAGTNPDVGIGGGMQVPPDGSSGIGTSPYGAYQPGFAKSLLRRLGLYNLF